MSLPTTVEKMLSCLSYRMEAAQQEEPPHHSLAWKLDLQNTSSGMGRRTCTAPRQSQGSDRMVSVETAQPSRAESEWSISMDVNGGLASTYRAPSRKCSTHSTMRDMNCALHSGLQREC